MIIQNHTLKICSIVKSQLIDGFNIKNKITHLTQ